MYSPGIFRAVLAVASVWTGVFLALAGSVAYLFVADLPQNALVLRTLRSVATLSTTVLFIPFTGVLLRGLGCPAKYDGWMNTGWDCSGSGRVIVAVILGLVLTGFVVLSLFLASVYVDRSPASTSWRARSYGRVDVVMLLMKLGLGAAYNLGNKVLFGTWALTIVLIVIGIIWFYCYFARMPLVHPAVNAFQAGLALGFTWTGCALGLTQLLHDSPPDRVYVTTVFVIGLGALATYLRYTWICRKEMADCSSLPELNVWCQCRLQESVALDNRLAESGDRRPAVSDQSRYETSEDHAGGGMAAAAQRNATPSQEPHGGSSAQEGSTEWVHMLRGRRTQLLQEADAGYRIMMEHYGDQELSFLLAAVFFRDHLPFRYNEALALSRAAMQSPGPDIRFYIYLRAEELRASGKGKMSNIDRVLLNQYWGQTMQLDIEAARRTVNFWETLSDSVPDLYRMERTVERLHSTLAFAENLYKKMMRLNPESAAGMRAYANHLLQFHHRPSKAQELLNKADRVDNLHTRGERLTTKQFALGTEARRESGVVDSLKDSSSTITISGNPSNIGEIVMVSPALCRLFGYTSSQLLGQNVSILIPPPIRRRHDWLLQQFQFRYSSNTVNRTKMQLGVHRQGWIIPIWMLVTEAPPDEETFSPRFTATMEPIPKDEDYILFGTAQNNFRVYAASFGSLRMLGISPDDLHDADDIPLTTWFPSLTPGYAGYVPLTDEHLASLASLKSVIAGRGPHHLRADNDRRSSDSPSRRSNVGDQFFGETSSNAALRSALQRDVDPSFANLLNCLVDAGDAQRMPSGHCEPVMSPAAVIRPPRVDTKKRRPSYILDESRIAAIGGTATPMNARAGSDSDRPRPIEFRVPVRPLLDLHHAGVIPVQQTVDDATVLFGSVQSISVPSMSPFYMLRWQRLSSDLGRLLAQRRSSPQAGESGGTTNDHDAGDTGSTSGDEEAKAEAGGTDSLRSLPAGRIGRPLASGAPSGPQRMHDEREELQLPGTPHEKRRTTSAIGSQPDRTNMPRPPRNRPHSEASMMPQSNSGFAVPLSCGAKNAADAGAQSDGTMTPDTNPPLPPTASEIAGTEGYTQSVSGAVRTSGMLPSRTASDQLGEGDDVQLSETQMEAHRKQAQRSSSRFSAIGAVRRRSGSLMEGRASNQPPRKSDHDAPATVRVRQMQASPSATTLWPRDASNFYTRTDAGRVESGDKTHPMRTPQRSDTTKPFTSGVPTDYAASAHGGSQGSGRSRATSQLFNSIAVLSKNVPPEARVVRRVLIGLFGLTALIATATLVWGDQANRRVRPLLEGVVDGGERMNEMWKAENRLTWTALTGKYGGFPWNETESMDRYRDSFGRFKEAHTRLLKLGGRSSSVEVSQSRRMEPSFSTRGVGDNASPRPGEDLVASGWSADDLVHDWHRALSQDSDSIALREGMEAILEAMGRISRRGPGSVTLDSRDVERTRRLSRLLQFPMEESLLRRHADLMSRHLVLKDSFLIGLLLVASTCLLVCEVCLYWAVVSAGRRSELVMRLLLQIPRSVALAMKEWSYQRAQRMTLAGVSGPSGDQPLPTQAGSGAGTTRTSDHHPWINADEVEELGDSDEDEKLLFLEEEKAQEEVIRRVQRYQQLDRDRRDEEPSVRVRVARNRRYVNSSNFVPKALLKLSAPLVLVALWVCSVELTIYIGRGGFDSRIARQVTLETMEAYYGRWIGSWTDLITATDETAREESAFQMSAASGNVSAMIRLIVDGGSLNNPFLSHTISLPPLTGRLSQNLFDVMLRNACPRRGNVPECVSGVGTNLEDGLVSTLGSAIEDGGVFIEESRQSDSLWTGESPIAESSVRFSQYVEVMALSDPHVRDVFESIIQAENDTAFFRLERTLRILLSVSLVFAAIFLVALFFYYPVAKRTISRPVQSGRYSLSHLPMELMQNLPQLRKAVQEMVASEIDSSRGLVTKADMNRRMDGVDVSAVQVQQPSRMDRWYGTVCRCRQQSAVHHGGSHRVHAANADDGRLRSSAEDAGGGKYVATGQELKS